jgi:hypothetical protein
MLNDFEYYAALLRRERRYESVAQTVVTRTVNSGDIITVEWSVTFP